MPSWKTVVPTRANQGNAVRPGAHDPKRSRANKGQSRGCPRNCERRAEDHSMPLGSFDPGKVVRGPDPQARRPATSHGHARTRRAGCSEASQELRPAAFGRKAEVRSQRA